MSVATRHTRSGRSARLGLAALLLPVLFVLIAPLTASAQPSEKELRELARKALRRSSPEVFTGPPLHPPVAGELIELGDDGLWEWRDEKPSPCRVTVVTTDLHPELCRHCAGRGKTLKLTEEAPCHGCIGGEIDCHVCGGEGEFSEVDARTGGARKTVDCWGCNGKGRFKCTLCKGKRVLKLGRVKGRKLVKAERLDLIERRAALRQARDEVLKAIDLDHGKEASKLISGAKKAIPYAAKHLRLMRKLEGYQKRLNEQVDANAHRRKLRELFKERIRGQIDWEIRLLEIAIERIELNQRLANAPKPEDESK